MGVIKGDTGSLDYDSYHPLTMKSQIKKKMETEMETGGNMGVSGPHHGGLTGC